MNVWRKQTVRWRRNGKTVPTGTPKATRQTVHSKRFYGTLTLASGQRKQQPLTDERASSQTFLRRLQTQENEKRANGTDRYAEQRQRPLTAFLDDYKSYLRAKGNTPLHCTNTAFRIRSVMRATKATTIGDLDAGRIVKTLATWRTRTRKPLSIATSNHYAIAIKSFSRWLWQERYSPDDPLAGLRRMNAETDRKRERRPLANDELQRLTLVTQTSNVTYRGDDSQADNYPLSKLVNRSRVDSVELARMLQATRNVA